MHGLFSSFTKRRASDSRPTTTGHERIFYGRSTGGAFHRRTHSSSSKKRPTPPTAVSPKVHFQRHTLTRTRSESDLIRARAKQKLPERWESDDDDSERSSVPSLDEYGRGATSLRSFHTEDEDRFALENAHHFKEAAAAIKRERANTLECTPEENEETIVGAKVAPAAVHEQAEPDYSQRPSHPVQAAASQEVEASVSKQFDPSIGSTSNTSALLESDVEVEYIWHENELLKKSLAEATREQNRLAQENLALRRQLDDTRYQISSLLVARKESYHVYPSTVSGSPPMYTTPSGSPPTALGRDYAYYGKTASPKTQTFEDLLNE
jgi:hypothetical protein